MEISFSWVSNSKLVEKTKIHLLNYLNAHFAAPWTLPPDATTPLATPPLAAPLVLGIFNTLEVSGIANIPDTTCILNILHIVDNNHRKKSAMNQPLPQTTGETYF